MKILANRLRFIRSVVMLVGIMLLAKCDSNETRAIINEKEVFQELLPALLDSIYVEVSYQMRPPSIVIDSITGKVNYITKENDAGLKESIRRDLVIDKERDVIFSFVIDDSIRTLTNYEFQEFSNHEQFKEDTLSKAYKLDLNALRKISGLNLIAASEFIPVAELNPKHRILEVLYFSRIVFNHQGDFGILTCKFRRGIGTGHDYQIYIRQKSDKWNIEKIKLESTL